MIPIQPDHRLVPQEARPSHLVQLDRLLPGVALTITRVPRVLRHAQEVRHIQDPVLVRDQQQLVLVVVVQQGLVAAEPHVDINL